MTITKLALKSFGLLLIFIFFESCSNPDEAIPSYIYIKPIELVGNTNTVGSLRHGLTDAWIYVNGNYLGAYYLPAKIPVLASGKTEIQVFPGIMINGSVTNRLRYPMVSSFKTTMDLKEKGVDSLQTITMYEPDIQFPIIENFESTHFFHIDVDGDAQTQVTLSTPEEAYEGNHSGLIVLDTTHSAFESWYDFEKMIPITPNAVYIEVCYKSDIKCAIGLIGIDPSGVEDNIDGIMLPKSSWTHIYFDFTKITNNNHKDNYRLALRAVYDNNTKIAQQKIWIDNIKLIYRP